MDGGRVLPGLMDPLQPAPCETLAPGSLDLPFEHPEIFMKVKACKRVQLPLPTCTHWFSQFSSVAQSCPTLCDPVNYSMPGLPVHHQLPEFTQTHVH